MGIYNFRLGYVAWELSLGNFSLESFVWELSFGNFSLGTFAWELSLGASRLGSETGGTGWLDQVRLGLGGLPHLPGLQDIE